MAAWVGVWERTIISVMLVSQRFDGQAVIYCAGCLLGETSCMGNAFWSGKRRMKSR